MTHANLIKSLLRRLTCLLLIAALACPAFAQNKGANKGNNNKINNGQPTLEELRDHLRIGPNGIPAPADRTKSIEARRDLDDAQEQLQKAMMGSNATPHAIENELSKNDDYRALEMELRRAQSDYDMVRKPIFDALRNDAYYAELERKKAEGEKVMNNLVLTGRGSFDWLYPHALAALEIRRRMTNEQIRAMMLTPEVQEARQRVIFTAMKLRAMRQDYTTSVNTSDAVRNAKADLATAKNRADTARQTLAEALQEESDYDRYRELYMAELKRTGKLPAGAN